MDAIQKDFENKPGSLSSMYEKRKLSNILHGEEGAGRSVCVEENQN